MSDPLETVRSRLRGARFTYDHGHRFKTQCPVVGHGQGRGDLRPSLCVSTGDDGRALLDCKAGCSTVDVIAALDLSWPDLFPQPSPPLAARAHAGGRTGASDGNGNGDGEEDVTSGRTADVERSATSEPREVETKKLDQMESLLRGHREGRWMPVEWDGPPIPDDLPPIDREVAEFVVLMRGLLLLTDDAADDMVLPTNWVERVLDLPKMTGWRALRRLSSDEVGFLLVAAQLPDYRGRPGALLYLPGDGPRPVDSAVEEVAAALPDRALRVEPDDDVLGDVDERQEADEDASVLGAVPDDGRVAAERGGGLEAARAGAAGVHAGTLPAVQAVIEPAGRRYRP